MPSTQTSPALHLLRFLIFNLQWSKPFLASKLAEHDFVIPRQFDGRARCFEFCISTNELHAVADSDEEEVQMYKIGLNDSSHFLYISDGYWFKPPVNPKSNFEIFRLSDPTKLITNSDIET